MVTPPRLLNVPRLSAAEVFCLSRVQSRNPYRLALKVLALLLPPAVVTLTLSRPKTAFAGTLHLMRVLVQET